MKVPSKPAKGSGLDSKTVNSPSVDTKYDTNLKKLDVNNTLPVDGVIDADVNADDAIIASDITEVPEPPHIKTDLICKQDLKQNKFIPSQW